MVVSATNPSVDVTKGTLAGFAPGQEYQQSVQLRGHVASSLEFRKNLGGDYRAFTAGCLSRWLWL